MSVPERNVDFRIYEALHLLNTCHPGHGFRHKKRPERCSICAWIVGTEREVWGPRDDTREPSNSDDSGRHLSSDSTKETR